MSLDGILYTIIKNPGKSQHKDISKKDIINKKFHHKTDSDKLFVMLPGWGSTLKYNAVLRKVISRYNHSFLEYEFPREILSSDWKKTIECFDIIRDEVIIEIRKLKRKYKFNSVYVAGISLGSFHACRIANNNKDITDLCLITPGLSLAETIWKGILTQNIRKDYEIQGITLTQLKKYWKKLEPENNVDKLHGKKITLIMSKADQVVPFYSGNKLFVNLKKHRYNIYNDTNNSLGHLLTGAKFYANPEKALFKEIKP